MNRRIRFAALPVMLIAGLVSGATVDGIQIHSSSHGVGPKTVILVHGWTCDETTWDAQVPALSKQYRVVTLDLPGHGKSAPPKDGMFSMELFAKAVEAVRSEAKVDKIVLVGHSMGTPVVVQYARMFPQQHFLSPSSQGIFCPAFNSLRSALSRQACRIQAERESPLSRAACRNASSSDGLTRTRNCRPKPARSLSNW